jgi:hypothetical protein
MANPLRLTLSRRKGFNLQAASHAANGLPATTVVRPGRWGNPFVIGRDGTQAECVARYRAWLALPQQAMPRGPRSAAAIWPVGARPARRAMPTYCWDWSISAVNTFA